MFYLKNAGRNDTTAGILKRLVRAKGGFISGEALGAEFGISRAAAAKNIKKLEAAGYSVEHRYRSGYALKERPLELNHYELSAFLDDSFFIKPAIYFPKLDSTQSYLKALASKGVPEGMLVVAGEQVSGKGRLGRGWISPPGGLWFSFLLKPVGLNEAAPVVPLAAALSISEAMKKSGIKTGLKWPNDIFLNGKKIGGILAESELEQDALHWMIIGVGLNLNFSRDKLGGLGKATSVVSETGRTVSHISLINDFAAIFAGYYKDIKEAGTKEICRRAGRLLLFKGNKISLNTSTGTQEGVLKGLTDNGEVLLQTTDGHISRFSSGEIVSY